MHIHDYDLLCEGTRDPALCRSHAFKPIHALHIQQKIVPRALQMVRDLLVLCSDS
jgi:hypothetical protein